MSGAIAVRVAMHVLHETCCIRHQWISSKDGFLTRHILPGKMTAKQQQMRLLLFNVMVAKCTSLRQCMEMRAYTLYIPHPPYHSLGSQPPTTYFLLSTLNNP